METFPRYWPFVRGIHRFPMNSPHKGQWRGALMFSLICVWINGWVNNREADDLIRHRAHYYVIVMLLTHVLWRTFPPVKWVVIGSGKGGTPIRRQVVTRTNGGLLWIVPWETTFGEISIEMRKCIAKCSLQNFRQVMSQFINIETC